MVITLRLAVYERRREIGLLRAVGMTKRQVRSSVLWESLITGVVGVVMGVVLGIVLGWIIVKALRGRRSRGVQVPTSARSSSRRRARSSSACRGASSRRRASKANMLEAIATT